MYKCHHTQKNITRRTSKLSEEHLNYQGTKTRENYWTHYSLKIIQLAPRFSVQGGQSFIATFLLFKSFNIHLKIFISCLPNLPLIKLILSTAKLNASWGGELLSLLSMRPSIFHRDLVTLSVNGDIPQRAYQSWLVMMWG